MLVQDTEKRQYSLHKYAPDFSTSEVIIENLKVDEGEKYTFTEEGYLIKVNVNPENGIIKNEEIEALLI